MSKIEQTVKDIVHVYLGMLAIAVFVLGIAAIGIQIRHDLGRSGPTNLVFKGSTLHFSGYIGFDALRYIKRNKHGIRTVILNSGGGSMQAGQQIAKILRTEGITTVVESGSLCASACTVVFQGGDRRVAAPDAVFMYHAPYTLVKRTIFTWKNWHTLGVERTVAKKFSGQAGAERFMDILNYGLSKSFIDNIPLDREGEIRDTAFNLYKYGDIGLVTEFLPQTIVWTKTGGKVLPARYDG